MDWIAFILTTLGVVSQIQKWRITFVFFMVSNILWGYIGFKNEIYGMVVANVFLFILGVWGIIKWTKDLKKDES